MSHPLYLIQPNMTTFSMRDAIIIESLGFGMHSCLPVSSNVYCTCIDTLSSTPTAWCLTLIPAASRRFRSQPHPGIQGDINGMYKMAHSEVDHCFSVAICDTVTDTMSSQCKALHSLQQTLHNTIGLTNILVVSQNSVTTVCREIVCFQSFSNHY